MGGNLFDLTMHYFSRTKYLNIHPLRVRGATTFPFSPFQDLHLKSRREKSFQDFVSSHKRPQCPCDSESQSLFVQCTAFHSTALSILLSTSVTTVWYVTMTSIKCHQMSLVQTIYCIFATKIGLIHSQSQSNQMHCSISWFAKVFK